MVILKLSNNLFQNSANMDLRRCDESALDIAMRKGYHNIVQFLDKYKLEHPSS